MTFCTYGSIKEQSEDDSPVVLSLDGQHDSDKHVPPLISSRQRFLLSTFSTLATLLVISVVLHISPTLNTHTIRNEESSLVLGDSDSSAQWSSKSAIPLPTNQQTLQSASEYSSSLQELQWKRISDDTGRYYVGFLEFCNIGEDVYFYRAALSSGPLDVPCENSTTTVAPVIRMKPRTNYKLILINRSDKPTNLHTHGFHVSGVGISDDITRKVEPGFCLEYHYRIRDNADVGLFWYHSHRHPIARVQVAGGAFGLLVIDEPHMETSFPLHLQRFFRTNEVLLQYLCVRDVDKVHRTHLLNGRATATNITMNHNEYYNFRISTVVISDPISYVEIIPHDACEARPMAYDGVFRSSLPHPESSAKHMMTTSSRLDLAVKCHEDAQVVFHQGKLSKGAGLLNIVVTGSGESEAGNGGSNNTNNNMDQVVLASPFWDAEQQTSWTPRRPYYLPDLANVNTNFWKINSWNVTMDFVMVPSEGNVTKPQTKKEWSINHIRWDPEIAIRELQLGQLVEWTLINTNAHPFHIHINKMQIVQKGGCGYRYEEGEYYDTIASDDPCLVRLQFWDFSGRVVAHCHKLSHEDDGMMVWIDVMGSDHGVNGTAQAACSDF